MIGQTVSHYRVTAKLGEGGMGEVYLAEDNSLDRRVALKFLPEKMCQDETARKRLLREAKSAAALDHPYICNVFEIGEVDGKDFISMEYVEGETLKTRLERGPLPLQEALKVAAEIAEALEDAHKHGIVHRDVKPSNIMLTSKGHAKVMDFGLARPFSGSTTEDPEKSLTALTERGSTLGTLAYMSPEQVRGIELDARSDIFSFGVVLYEMLTGVHPFRKALPAETAAAIQTETAPPLARYRDDIPELLQHIVRKMLAKQPGGRYQLMHEVGTDLQALRRGREDGLPRRAWGVPWMGIGLAAALAVLVGVSGLYLLTLSPDPVDLAPVPLTGYAGSEASATFSPGGEQIAFVWDGPQEDNFDIYVQQIGVGQPLRRTDHPSPDWSPAWSPDGNWIALLRDIPDQKAAVILIPPLGGGERELAEIRPTTTFRQRQLSWSADSRWLAVRDLPDGELATSLFLLSVETGEMRRITDAPPEEGGGDMYPGVSPDGRTLAFVRTIGLGYGDLFLLDLAEDLTPKGEPRSLTGMTSQINSPSWSEDGKTIVFSAGFWPHPWLWSIPRTGGQPRRLVFSGEGAYAPAISPQGHRLVYTRYTLDRNIWRVELVPGTGRIVGSPQKWISSSRLDWFMAYSTDGKRIAFSSTRSGGFEIWVCDSDGFSDLMQLTDFGAGGKTGGAPRWSPDGRWIVFDSRSEEGQADIYTVSAQGGVLRRLTSHPTSDMPRIWSRDGRWIYFISGRSGQYELWRMPPDVGEEQAVQVTRDGAISVQESRDGRFLFYTKWRRPGLWRIEVATGEEVQLSEAGFGGPLAVGDDCLYWSFGGNIHFLDLKTGEIERALDCNQNWDLSLSPDGRFLLYSQTDRESSDLMLVENWDGSTGF